MGTDLKQFELNGMALHFSKRCTLQDPDFQIVYQDIREGWKVQPQLVHLHGRRGGPVGKQIQLLLVDAVLHVPMGAMQFFVHLMSDDLTKKQVRDDEVRVLSLGQILRFSDHAPRTRPAVQGSAGEVFIDSLRLVVFLIDRLHS